MISTFLQRAVLPVLAIALLAGCAPTIKGNPETFDLATKEFNRMLRWKELESACGVFFPPELKERCVERATRDRGVSIAETRVTKKELNVKDGTGVVRIEIDYYIMPSNVVKSVDYLENWEFHETETERGWRVKNLPPEFK